MNSAAKLKINIDNQQRDLVQAGFRKLDDNLVERRAPTINWGKIYQEFTDSEKVDYLEKLAATMNHAAHLIQEERNQLNALMEKKEQQLEAMKKAIAQNNELLQKQITEMNEDRQSFNKRVAELNKEIRELRAVGNIH
jgi:ABC-type transporter Mla subunit MlaD